MTGYDNETYDTLCNSQNFNGMEDCTVTTTSSIFYTKVRVSKVVVDHDSLLTQ